MESPSIINFENWRNFPYQLDKMSLDGVKRLRSFCGDLSEVPWDQGKLLKRCRNLERFSAPLRSADDFKWAVEERKDRETYEGLLQNGVACPASSLSLGRSHGGHFGPGPDPVPLRRVSFRTGNDTYVVPALKDVCSVFNKTLERINVRLWSVPESLDLGVICDMPCLTMIYLRVSSMNFFCNDASFLKGCPALETLTLVDTDSHIDDATPVSILAPWHLPKLKALTLIGFMCEVFNYESLMHTPEIETLHLERSIDDMGVCKASEEYLECLSRPSWSWNWVLPRLCSVILKGLPAHLFRPSLLRGCPKLQRIHLDLNDVPRTVSRSRDLILGDEGFQSPVRSLEIKGRWIVTETPDLFSQFLQMWFNGLHYLKMDAAQFPSNKSMLDGLHSIKSLRKACLRRHRLSNYEAWELKLEEVDIKVTHEWDRKHRIELSVAAAREQRLVAREKQRQGVLELAKQVLESLKTLESQDKPDVTEAAPGALDNADVNGTGQGQDGEPSSETLKDRVRCDSVDSACEIEPEISEEEAMALEEQEAEEEYLSKILRCVYVFKGKRYHSKVEYDGDL
ncbi:hypothetical protein BGZ58_011277 [Dissophora ornata]|nr:hypothetical protein BGZ58_011277 [Dissophora ornata]